jgi:hypothetical protein
MSQYPEIAERFASETTEHKMTIKHDDGLYRHLRFMKPDSSSYWFDLVTWPGKLAFVGDGTGYVFSRDEDMFAFFRIGSGYGINPTYWSEKLVTDRDSVRTYSETKFREHVIDAVRDAGGEYPGLWKAVKNDVFDEDFCDWQYEDNARQLVNDFSFTVKRPARQDFVPEPVKPKTFRFTDTWEWDLRDYDWWFLWACHGIAWGIQQYDGAKQSAVTA